MPTAKLNRSIEIPHKWQYLAASVKPAADLDFTTDDAENLAWRVVHVDHIVDAVTLYDLLGVEHVISLEHLLNNSGQVLGQWSGIKTGTNSYNFRVGQ